MPSTLRYILTTLLIVCAAGAAPKMPPPKAPPKGRVKVRAASPTAPGRILTLKPGQTRLTPAQLKLVTAKPAARKKPPAKKAGR